MTNMSEEAERPVASDLDGDAVVLWPGEDLAARFDHWPGMRSRWIIPPTKEGWDKFALSEWELEKAAWTDLHHHVEVNVILEGELTVECDGLTVVGTRGDTVRVGAGKLGRYSAPVYARMLAVYGPNPGREDEEFSYEPI